MEAPDEGFQRDTAVTIAADAVLVVRSRSSNQACSLLGSLPRYGKAEEIASFVAYLAGPESGYITGANLMIDGGFSA